MPHDVFVSYSSKDKPTADALVAVVERHGIRCWVAPRDIAPGAEWGESIINGINGSRAFVLVFSGSANDSPQIKREVERAVNRAVPVIPFRIEQVAPSGTMEYFISTPHWLDAFTLPLEQHLEQLVKTLRGFLPEGAVPAAMAAAAAPGGRAAAPVASRGGAGKLIAAVVAGLVVLGAVAWAGATYLGATRTPPPHNGAFIGLSGTWARDFEHDNVDGVEVSFHRSITFSNPGSASVHDDVTVTQPGRKLFQGCRAGDPNSGTESYDAVYSVGRSDQGMIILTPIGDRSVSNISPSCWQGIKVPLPEVKLKWDGRALTNPEGDGFTRVK